MKKRSNERYVSANEIALVHAGLGEKDLALEWLEKAYEDLSIDPYVKVDPIYDSLRQDHRFVALLKKMAREK